MKNTQVTFGSPCIINLVHFLIFFFFFSGVYLFAALVISLALVMPNVSVSIMPMFSYSKISGEKKSNSMKEQYSINHWGGGVYFKFKISKLSDNIKDLKRICSQFFNNIGKLVYVIKDFSIIWKQRIDLLKQEPVSHKTWASLSISVFCKSLNNS